MTPLVKCFCTNGYTIRMGSTANTMMAILIDTEFSCP